MAQGLLTPTLVEDKGSLCVLPGLCVPLCPAAHEIPPLSAQGDSGGPLSCQLNNTWFVMGLSSWSLPCHRPVNPSVFTRLTHFSRWIREKQRATPPPTASPHRPATTNGPSSAGAFPRPGFRTAWLLSQALPLLLLLSLLGVP